MEEVQDFEGFTPEDCERNLKLRTCIEQIIKARPSNTSTEIKKKKKGRGWRTKKLSQSPQPLKGQTDRTSMLNFWQLREQHTSDTPHTLLDHAHWFEKVMAGFGDKNKSMNLTYHSYIKLANLESSVNTTMFISDSNEFTSQRLWDQLVHRNTSRVSKMEKTLNLSPLFYLVTHRKVWERIGVKCQGGKNPTSAYPFIHWLGILEQRKVWAGLGPPDQILELRKECIKAILLKYGLLTVEDIVKIICSSFHIPHCAELTDVVYQTLSSCKIFHKSQDQEEDIANSKHFMDLGPRPSQAKRVPKPSLHYKRAVRTAALYKELIKGDSISDINLQTDSDGSVGESEITEIAWIPALESEMLDETNSPSWDMVEESEEQTFNNSHHPQSQIRTEHYLLNEKDSHGHVNHNEWNEDRFSWKNSCIEPQEELFGNHKTLPSTSMESVTNETFPSTETKVLASEVNQFVDTEEIQESKTLFYKEGHESSSCLSNDSSSNANILLLYMKKDKDSEMSKKNKCNTESASKNLSVTFDSTFLKSSQQCEDGEDYRCPLFARTTYYISSDKISHHSLPNKVILTPPATTGSTVDTDLSADSQDLVDKHPENSGCLEPKCISDNEAHKTHSIMHSDRSGYLNMNVGEIYPKTSISENSDVSETENIHHPELQGNVRKDPCLLQDSSAKEHKSSTNPMVSVALSGLTDTEGEKSSEKRQNMEVISNTERNRTTRYHASLYLDGYGSKIQHHSSTGEVTGSYKSFPPEAEQFENYQRNGLSRHQEANGGTEIKNSSHFLTTAKSNTKMLREFRYNKYLQSCGSLKESPEEKSSPFFVQNITRKESCVIIDLHEQQRTKENMRDAQGSSILLDHQRDETTKLTDLSTCKTLPKISVGNRGTENSSALASYANWQLAESNHAQKNRTDSKLRAQNTTYPGYEHSYSRNMKKLSKQKNITQASKPSVLKCFRAPEIVSVTEEPSMMQDHGTTKVSMNASVRQHKPSSLSVIHTSEAPSITSHLRTTEISDIVTAHSMTQDYLSTRKSDSLLGETDSNKFCSTQDLETPDMAQHLKTKKSEALNKIHDNLTTVTPVDTLRAPQVSRSSEAPSVLQDHLKSTTSMDSSVQQNEPTKHCVTQVAEAPCMAEHLQATQVSYKSEVSNIIQNCLTSTASVDTEAEQDKPNNPGISKGLETAITVEHLTHEINSSSEASTVIQEHLTSSTSDTLVPGTCLTKQPMSESNVNSNPLKRQRWKSFKLRDHYEQDFRCKATKISKKRSSFALHAKSLEKYKEPLLKGWVREVVNRTTVSSSNTKDIYYHTPDGKKLRSSVEIDKYLLENGVMDLSLENFSFFRAWLGFREPYEVVRMAAPKRFSSSSGSSGHSPVMYPQRTSRRHFLPGARNSQEPRATSEDCLIIDKTLPSDRFWVTSFEDFHNTMETDTIEIVNENGELTGYEEWAPDSASKENQHITVTNDEDSTSSSETLTTTTTTSTTSTNDTATATNTTTTVTASMNTVYSTACMPSTFTTPSITSTPASSTITSSTAVDSTSVSPLAMPTPACITTTQESMTTTSTVTTTTAFTITTLASMAREPLNISTTSNITSRPTSLVNTDGITPMSTTINPTPARPTITYASISTQTDGNAVPVNNTPATPKLIPRSSSTNTNVTMSPSDITSAISGMPTQDTTSSHSYTHASPVVGPALHNATARQHKQFFQPGIFKVHTGLQPRILNVYKPADARKLFNTLDSPSDSERLDSSIQKANSRASTPPSHPSKYMQNRTTAATSRSTQSLIPPGNHDQSNEEDKHDFTYIIPNSAIDKDRLTKVKIKSSQLSCFPINSSWYRTQRSSLSNKDSQQSTSVSSNIHQSSAQDIWVRQQQPTSVMGNRQQPDSVLGSSSKEQSALVLGSSSEHQSTPVLSDEQHPAPVMRNTQQPTPATGNRQQQTPVMRNSQQQTSAMTNIQQPTPTKRIRQQPTPVIIHWQQPTPVMGSRQQQTPVIGIRQQQTSITQNRQHPTPAMSNRQQPYTDIKRRQQPYSVMGNRQQPTLVMSNRQQQTPVMGNKQQSTPVMGNRQQPILIMTNRQQPTQVMGNRQWSNPVITNTQQLPASVSGNGQYWCPRTRIGEPPASVTGERQQSSTGIGNMQQATYGFVNTVQSSLFMSNKQQKTPAMCSRQQSTPASIGNHESTQVTNCFPQATPVMSYKQQSAPVISMHQSMSVSVSDFTHQSDPAMSHKQQSTPVTSSCPVISEKWALLPISAGQQAAPHSLTISAAGQHAESSHHTVMNMSNVCQTPSATDKIHHVIPENSNVCQTLPLQSKLHKMIPDEAHFQHINVVNHALQVIPAVSSVPVASSINNDSYTDTRSNHAGLGSNTTNVNTSNHAPVGIKKSKQTARKSTKSNPFKTKPSPHVKLFVDDGILALEPDSTSIAVSKNASNTDVDIIVSEPSSISLKNIPVSLESCLEESVKTFLQLQAETGKADSPQKFTLPSSLPHGHPYMNTNLKSTIQENHNKPTNYGMTSQFPVVKSKVINNTLGKSATIKPPPPLQMIPPQITRKVNKVTCPPLTPISQMLSKFPIRNNSTPSPLSTASSQTTPMTQNISSASPSLYPLVPSTASQCQTSSISQNHASLLPSVPSIVPSAASQTQTPPSTTQNSSSVHPSVYVPKTNTASLNHTSSSYS